MTLLLQCQETLNNVFLNIPSKFFNLNLTFMNNKNNLIYPKKKYQKKLKFRIFRFSSKKIQISRAGPGPNLQPDDCNFMDFQI